MIISPEVDLWTPRRRHAPRVECSLLSGFSFGAGRASKKAGAVFDPATLSLTAWWRAAYAGSPWVGVASAGSSGSRDLTEATNPPTANNPLNGRNIADFDGTNDVLANATAISTLLSASAYFGWVLFYADAITGANGEATFFNNEPLLSDTGGFFAIALTTSGGNSVQCAHWDGTGGAAALAVSTGQYNLACFRYDGTDIRAKLNSGSVVTRARGSISALTGTLRVALNFSGLAFYNGRIADVGLMASAESDARFDDIKAYINDYHALSL